MMLFFYSRVGKNRDPPAGGGVTGGMSHRRDESPAGVVAGRGAQWFLPGGFSR